MKLSGKRPSNLGVTDGRLAPCPDSPNCVSSQARDRRHAVAPLTFDGDATVAMQRLRSIVAGQPRTRIVIAEDDYLYVEFSSALLGFVDDVEFYCDGEVIHVRSASRLGYSDLGVNRKRVDAIRRAFAATGG